MTDLDHNQYTDSEKEALAAYWTEVDRGLKEAAKEEHDTDHALPELDCEWCHDLDVEDGVATMVAGEKVWL